MGSRLFSNTTNLLGGHDFANPAHRRKVADVLGIDEATIPREASWPYHRILEGILRGEIRGLWVVATNPAHSWINQGMARDVLDRLDFLVVQDMYHTTETAQLAHLVLPAAGWGEKDGTFINSERRIGVVRQSAPARRARRSPTSTSSSWSPTTGAAAKCFASGNRPRPCFNCSSSLSAGQPCDITGIDDYGCSTSAAACNGRIPADCARSGPRAAALRGRPVLSRRWPRAIPLRSAAAASRTAESKVPVRAAHRPRLGRAMAHANSHGKIGRAAQALRRELYVEINPQDATDSAFARAISSPCRRNAAAVNGRAVVTPAFNRAKSSFRCTTRAQICLTDAAFDPYSHQPAYKSCAVNVELAS